MLGSQEPMCKPGKGFLGSHKSFRGLWRVSLIIVPQGFGAKAPKKGMDGSSCTTPSRHSSSEGLTNHSGKNLGMGVAGSWSASRQGSSGEFLWRPWTIHLFHLVGWDGICRYVFAMHNLHGKKFGKTPRRVAS